MPLRRTPIFPKHQALGARLVEFGGWEMPVQYTSIVDEHTTVRTQAGLFDISHMGEFFFEGAAAVEFLSDLLTNDPAKLEVGQGQYTLMCNDQGGTVDDLYLYRTGREKFMAIVNASRAAADAAWVRHRLTVFLTAGGVRFEDISDLMGAVALQGPLSAEILSGWAISQALSPTARANIPQMTKNRVIILQWRGHIIYLARTGYTGEDGFEFVAPGSVMGDLWDTLMAAGTGHGLKPCGLGARDTLRTEMGYPLYGHELGEDITPIEAGLGSFVSFDKPRFCGRDALLAQKTSGPNRRCVAFKLAEKAAPPRPGYPIWHSSQPDAPVGTVVSGTQSPSLGLGIGMGFVPTPLAVVGTPLEIEVRGRKWPAEIVKKPIYRKPV